LGLAGVLRGHHYPRGAGCFGKNGDITYLDWMLSAWGWTVSVSLLALVLAWWWARDRHLAHLARPPVVVRLGNAWVELFRNIRCWCRFSSGTTWCRRCSRR
jgi:ABC-type amino acid transport system permease subunit